MSNALRMTEEELRAFVARGRAAQDAATAAVVEAICPGVIPPEVERSPDSGPQAKPRRRRGPNPETAIQDLVRRGLQVHPAVAWVVRMNTGQFEVGDGDRKRMVRAAFVGCPDLFGQMATGELLGIEVKRPGNKPTVEQQAVIDRINRHGGCAGCAHDVREAFEIVEGWAQNRRARQPLRAQ